MNMGKKATVGALIASLTFLGCQEKKAQQTPEEEVQESIDGSAADTVETGSSEQNSAGATAEGTTPDQPAQPAQPNQPETKRSGPVIPEFQDVKLLEAALGEAERLDSLFESQNSDKILDEMELSIENFGFGVITMTLQEFANVEDSGT